MCAPTPSDHHGFSLIECLIVLIIFGILAAVSMPAYLDHIRRGHRSDARLALLQAAHWMERAATATGSYPHAAQLPAGILLIGTRNSGPAIANGNSVTVAGERYAITAVTDGGHGFTLTATPIAGTAQAADRCGSLVLDQAGRRTVIDARLPPEQCWTR